MSVEIKTERLTLRPMTLGYLDSVHAYVSDLENTRYMCFLPNETREETEEFIRRAEAERGKPKPSYYEFVVLRSDVHVGAVSLYWLEDGVWELGWIVNKRFWGRGYATEAAQALMGWGRRELGMKRVIAQCDGENDASRRVMEKLGMRRVSLTGGRKNRASDEERQELTYEIVIG